MKDGKYLYSDLYGRVYLRIKDGSYKCLTADTNTGWEEGEKGDIDELIPSMWELVEDPEVTELREQLAKANERVAELEFQHQLLTKRIEPLLDMQEDGEYYARCHLADDIYEAFIEGSSVDALNKFAIENQIKGAKALIYAFPLNASDQMKEWVEQLRKEQE